MSVYRRGRTYWYSFVFAGRRIQRSTKSKNAKVAGDIERAAWTNLARGAVGLPFGGEQKNVTVGELLDRLKATCGDENKLSQQRLSVLKLARRAFGSRLANGLDSKDIESYIAEKRKEGKKNATINRITECVRRAFRVAKLSASEIRHLGEKDNARKGFFSNEEFRRVYPALPEDVRDFALFGYVTGWRKGEIASLTWLDLEDGLIRLRAEKSKNREPRSVVVAGELVSLIERRKDARLAKNGVLTNLVFHRNGDPIREFRKSWATACVAAGVGRMVCSNSRCKNEGVERKCPVCKARGLPRANFSRPATHGRSEHDPVGRPSIRRNENFRASNGLDV